MKAALTAMIDLMANAGYNILLVIFVIPIVCVISFLVSLSIRKKIRVVDTV
jgi:hypothetical protein